MVVDVEEGYKDTFGQSLHSFMRYAIIGLKLTKGLLLEDEEDSVNELPAVEEKKRLAGSVTARFVSHSNG